MTYKKSMTEILMGKLTSELQTFDQIAGGMTESERANASTTLSNLAKKGRIRREGVPRFYRYSLAAQQSRLTPEEACALVLEQVRGTDGLTLEEITARCESVNPKDIKAAIGELLFGALIKTEELHGATYYTHSGADLPPPDPLAAAFVPRSTRTRVAELQAELSALLEQQVGDRASPTVLHHIAAAGHHLHQLSSFID